MITIFKTTPNYNFLAKAKPFVILSICLVLISAGSIIFSGLKLGLDFRGGTEALVSFEQSLDIPDLKASLESAFETSVSVVPSGSDRNLLISFYKEDISDVQALLKAELSKKSSAFEILELGSIGPKIGAQIKENAWYTILISLALVLVYMSFRFNFQFGIGAIVALLHDAFITVGAFSLFQIEFDLTALAGILTLIGYSLNDSIVIIDRVRENIKRHPSKSLFDQINLSVNETLSRTILTFGTTLVIILAMFIWGGESIQGFSFSFLVGIVVGTYSSVFVASPVAIFIESRLRKPTEEMA